MNIERKEYKPQRECLLVKKRDFSEAIVIEVCMKIYYNILAKPMGMKLVIKNTLRIMKLIVEIF